MTRHETQRRPMRKRQFKESDLKIETALVVVAYVLVALNVLCFAAIVTGHAELMSWLVFFMDTGEFFVRFIVLALAFFWLYFAITWQRDLIRHRKMLEKQRREAPEP